MNSQTRFLVSGGLGIFLEFFDFALYSAVSTIIAHRFFPTFDPSTALLLSWGVFACSFIARPIGSIVFGHFSDKVGLKLTLTLSMIMMGLATIGIGLIPGYNAIGILAPLGLIFARLMQGFAIAPEYTGPSVYFSLGDAKKRLGFYGSLTVVAAGLGMWCGGLLISILSKGYTVESLPEIRWRLPFILSGCLIGGLTVYLRSSMDNRAPKRPEKYPLVNLKSQFGDFLGCTILSGYLGLSSYMIFGFLSAFLQSHRGLGLHQALSITTCCTIVAIVAAPIAGYFSDKMRRGAILKISVLLMFVLSILAFKIISYGDIRLVYISIAMMSILTGSFSGAFPAFLATTFPSSHRATGASFSHSLGISLLGGTGPFMMSYFYKKFDNPIMPAYYLCFVAALAFISLWLMNQKRKSSLEMMKNEHFA
jgi:MHS family proline/betaine transporter-like MFS transporter|tara:strand:+ start:561 stop:1826 length:1266 start_codon:yes stop_codon:yes gene_type:complete